MREIKRVHNLKFIKIFIDFIKIKDFKELCTQNDDKKI